MRGLWLLGSKKNIKKVSIQLHEATGNHVFERIIKGKEDQGRTGRNSAKDKDFLREIGPFHGLFPRTIMKTLTNAQNNIIVYDWRKTHGKSIDDGSG